MKILLPTLLMLAGIAAHSQTYNIVDTFDDNRYNWWISETQKGSEVIKNGKLEISTPEGGWLLSIVPYIAFEKDFRMEASMKLTDKADQYGYGIMWGYSQSKSAQNYFSIGAAGYYYISDHSKTKKAGLNEWVATKLVKPVGEVNKLRVEQSAKVLTFYINDQKVASIPAFTWVGTAVGIVTYEKLSLEVDDFKFQQDLKINLPPTLTKGLKKENLGPGVNTFSSDLVPIISADGKTLYFGRENYEGNVGGKDDGEDFYTSEFDGTKWATAKNMGSPINTSEVNNIVSVTSDENKLIFVTATEFLSRSRTSTGWGDAVEIGLSYVNEASYFEGFLSSDGKAILMATKNSNNLFYDKDVDERDIYVSVKDNNDKWSKPVNLGPTINTRFQEYSPFLAADGRTLYFSSGGRAGYGDVDIFMSKRIGDGWTSWSEPVNLGPEINTQYFDAYYTVPASGEYAYMVNNSGTTGADIIRIRLTPELKPNPVMLVKGKTLDAKTKKPIAANILVDNLSTQSEVGEAISDPKTGEFQIVLPYGVNTGFHAGATGYLSVNENLELKDDKYNEVEKDLFLVPIVEGQTLQLNNVFFEQAKATLKPESYPELDRLITIMQNNPTMEIELGGYTDNVGRPESLVALSMDRAGTVKKYMVEKGIPSKRIVGKGYGPANPIVKNDTEEHRRMNRRVEFKIIKK